MAPLMQLKPVYKGPLAFSLREAAKQLPNDGGPRSLVVIHDGPDDCRQDVCAAAAELASAGIAAHVVSLGVSPADIAKMACLWQATGGRHYQADTNEQVEAGIAEALRVASGDPSVAIGLAPGGPAWSGPLVPPAPVPATGPTALHLRALWAPNTDAVGVPLYWTVARKDAPDAVVFESSTSNPVAPVPPGDYVVTVRSELVTASQAVTVSDGRPKAVPIMLGAGTVRVRAVALRSSTPLADAVITIAAANGSPLAVFKGAEGATLLPPGRYRIAAEVGLVRAEQAVAVTEGRSAQVDLALNLGRLLLSATTPSEAAPLFVVMEDDPPRGRRQAKLSSFSPPAPTTSWRGKAASRRGSGSNSPLAIPCAARWAARSGGSRSPAAARFPWQATWCPIRSSVWMTPTRRPSGPASLPPCWRCRPGAIASRAATA